MIEETRAAYNAAFSQETYQKMVSELDQKLGRKIEFRIAETPVFTSALNQFPTGAGLKRRPVMNLTPLPQAID